MPASFFTGYLAQGVGPFSAFVENTASGYARVPVVFTPLNLGSAALSLGVTFPGSASYVVTQRALYDAPTGGNLILYWGLKNPVVVTGAGQDKISAGALNHFYPALSNNSGAGLNATPVTAVANAVIGQTNTGLPVYAGSSLQVVNGTISYSAVTTGGGLAPGNNLSDVTNVAAARSNLGLSSSTALSVADFLGGGSYGQNSGQDATVVIMNAIIAGYLKSLKASSSLSLNDQSVRQHVDVILPPGKWGVSDAPIVLPWVRLVTQGQLVRMYPSGGTISSFWQGNYGAGVGSLKNVFMPTLLTSVNGQLGDAQVYCNPDGSHQGSGIYFNKAWVIDVSNCTIATSPNLTASGWVVNETFILNQPAKAPYLPATGKVLTVDGNGKPLTVQILTGGFWEMPPLLQQAVYTTANGFTGANGTGIGGAVFDGTTGNYLTTSTSGSGTGLTITANYLPDWVAGNTRFGQFQSTLKGCAPVVGNVYINSVGSIVNDATYGNQFAFWSNGENETGGEIQVGGGGDGIILSGTDKRWDKLNPVNSVNLFRIYSGAHNSCPNVVGNASTATAVGLYSDNNVMLRLTGYLYSDNINGTTGITGPAMIMIGSQGNSTTLVVAQDLDFTFHDAGQNGVAGPIAIIDYSRGSSYLFKATNVNTRTGTPAINQVGSLFQLGAHNGFSNTYKGQIDYTVGPAVTGTLPNGGIDVYDAACPITADSTLFTITGTSTSGDTQNYLFTNLFLKALPYTLTYTAPSTGLGGSAMATAIAAQINADATLQPLGFIATAVSNAVTIQQPGSWGTVITCSVTGAASETVTFTPNSGTMSGGISGAQVKGLGLYDIIGNGLPTTITGWGKAPYGSTYMDTSAASGGGRWVNHGTATAPYWVPLNGKLVFNTALYNNPNVTLSTATGAQSTTAGAVVALGTNSTSEQFLACIANPAGLGKNAAAILKAFAGFAGTAVAKQLIIRASQTAATQAVPVQGTALYNGTISTAVGNERLEISIYGLNSQTSQVSGSSGLVGAGTSGGAQQTLALDWTKPWYWNITAVCSASTESVTLYAASNSMESV